MTDDEKVFRYAGGKLDVQWDGRLCIHVGECGRAEGELFVDGRKPWGQPDRASLEEVDAVVRRCPTGALSAVRQGEVVQEAPESRNEVVVANNGPLYLTGDLEIDGAGDDMPSVRYRAALCRCGRSNNKPFCDNSHEESGFRDRGAVGQVGESSGPEGGKLRVSRAGNGPLILKGRFCIRAGSGRLAWSGDKAALCRCGQSRNKPFCDGAHVEAGFQAD
jgi:CDGSH-type Zn-finger protein/uncharacterized Fe-S cluster protein YjdI